MTAQTAPQADGQGDSQKMVRYGILAATVPYLLLHDRRFHVTVITGTIGAVAFYQLIKNNEARPVRRAISWYLRSEEEKLAAHKRRH